MRRWQGVALACLLASACATLPRAQLGVDPPELARWRDGVKWDDAGDEAVRLLSGYLQVDTANPPGNETRGATYLAGLLQKDGIASEIVEFAPGRGSLIARLKGTGAEKPLCLLSHLDVVPAEAKNWQQPPFSGLVDANGMIWGRGALDMKGMGLIETMTLVWLKRLAVPLKRDVILLAVADEEVDNRGMQFIVQKYWPQIDCSHVVNEGGMGIRDAMAPGQTIFAISVAEKGLLWLKMIAHGKAGHGSTPIPGRAPDRLLDAIAKIRARHPEATWQASTREVLAQVGHDAGGMTGFVLTRPMLQDWLAEGQLMKNPGTRAAMIDTVNVTGFGGAEEPNVVPAEVWAHLDCRLLPGHKPQELLADLIKLVDDPNIRFEILHQAEANGSPWDDPFYRALARHAVAGKKNAVVGPVLSPGFTDSLLLRPLGVRAYGFVPFAANQDEAGTMHGENERVSSANVRDGLRVLFGAVVDVAALPGQ
jgi:acetylornithine deacetylase/succinyl-diaminopimelate desuccinylase-like protein